MLFESGWPFGIVIHQVIKILCVNHVAVIVMSSKTMCNYPLHPSPGFMSWCPYLLFVRLQYIVLIDLSGACPADSVSLAINILLDFTM